jgi:signal peptidase I
MTVDPEAKKENEPEKGKRKKSSGKGGLRESIFLLVCGVVVALLLQAFVFQSFWIPSESMENTLVEHDRVIVNKLHGASERGDIVVFKGWNNEDTIKRVIAIGGDTVKCCDTQKRITVNGVPIDEGDYLYSMDFPSGDPFEKVAPKGRTWVTTVRPPPTPGTTRCTRGTGRSPRTTWSAGPSRSTGRSPGRPSFRRPRRSPSRSPR